MKVRIMRLIVFFDLPMDTAAQRRQYRLFRKFIIKDGYLMMQESVYSKMVLDGIAADSAMKRLRQHKPSSGLVQVLRVTEKQYASIEAIAGDSVSHFEVDNTERLIVL